MFVNFLTELTATVLNIVTVTLVPLLCLMATNYLRQRFKLNISAQQQEQLTGLAQQAVMVASQTIFEGPRGADTAKLDAAVAKLQRDAKKIGVKLVESAATELIEAGVNRLRRARDAGLAL